MSDPNYDKMLLQIRSGILEFEQAVKKQVLDDMREWGKHRYVNTLEAHLDAYEKHLLND